VSSSPIAPNIYDPELATVGHCERATARTPLFRLDLPIIITIDGPAGTGKSSVARQLAKRLGLDFLDTGAMYRAATAIAIDRGIGIDNPDALIETLREARIRFDWRKDPPAILAWNTPLCERIRDADVTASVSPFAGIASLRALMVEKQRAIASDHPRLVTEGRDQGSVVFPDATVKFFLTASVAERARRRWRQLTDAGQPADLERLEAEIDERDQSDMSRKVGPLTRPDRAVVLDTSSLAFGQVVDELEMIVRRKAAEP
jgi:cytidylate kinase